MDLDVNSLGGALGQSHHLSGPSVPGYIRRLVTVLWDRLEVRTMEGMVELPALSFTEHEVWAND